MFCLFEAGLEESVKVLRQTVQLLSERNTLGYDYPSSDAVSSLV